MAIGHFDWQGDQLVLHPEFFAVDAAHCGGKADRTLTVPEPRSRVLRAHNRISIAFRLAIEPNPPVT